MANSKTNFWREVFSEDGVGSSKRIIGTIMIIVVMTCTAYLAIKDGGTQTVESLCETSLIVGASLLGLSSVTGIWKKGDVSNKISTSTEDKKYSE